MLLRSSSSVSLFCLLFAVAAGAAAAFNPRSGRPSLHSGNASALQSMGSINVEGVGEIFVVSNTPNNVEVSDNGFTLNAGGRIYFATYGAGDFNDPFMYWQTPLLGNHFSYEVDVNKVGCHCNAASYFAQLPGYDSGQNPTAGPGGDWYCDANFVNDNWCPEFDTFEGNRHTMSCALHTCDYVPPNDYSSCDRGGCSTNVFNADSSIMCPEGHCTINTQRPFTVSNTQSKGADGLMSNVNVWFEQEGRTANFNACGDQEYVKNMGYSLEGIVFVASLWGGPDIDMNWLDGMTGCQGICDLGSSSVTFKNFALYPEA